MLAWSAFAVYLAATAYLGWQGFKKTSGFASFALGDRAMHPAVVGITLAASTASAATFIVNPGFVYVDGISAWMHLCIAVGIGFMSMLTFLSFRFRRIGSENAALTIPDWVGKRYGSGNFALYFAVLNLLAFAFVVLLVGGISIVMQRLLGISNPVALAIIVGVTTTYVFVGGTYAHVLTNLLQGSLMIGVTLLVLGFGTYQILSEPGSLIEQLRAIDPNLIRWVNPEGALFNDWFSIYVAGFVVGAVIVCQPHILTKALYVKDDRAVRQYLLVFALVFGLFMLLVSVGLFARITLPPEVIVDPATGEFRQDLVMTVYLQSLFPEWVFVVVSVVLVAAAMSTLDGLLVAISTITANDLVLNLMGRFGLGPTSPEARMAFALRAGHGVLVVLAAAAFLVNLDPPRLLGIFGQVGVYGLAVAAAAPLVAGVLFERSSTPIVWTGSVAALAIHFLLYFAGPELWPEAPVTLENPGVTAAIATLVATPLTVLAARAK